MNIDKNEEENKKKSFLFFHGLSLKIILINQEVATEALWMNFMNSKDGIFLIPPI